MTELEELHECCVVKKEAAVVRLRSAHLLEIGEFTVTEAGEALFNLIRACYNGMPAELRSSHMALILKPNPVAVSKSEQVGETRHVSHFGLQAHTHTRTLTQTQNGLSYLDLCSLA